MAIAVLGLAVVAAAKKDKESRKDTVVSPFFSASAPTLSPPPIRPFEAGGRGIYLGGPWFKTDAGKSFCQDVKNLDYNLDVRCDQTVAWTQDNALREEFQRRANGAGALVAVAVSEEGTGRIFPLGKLESHPLLGHATLAIDFMRRSEAERIPILLNALSRKATPNPTALLDNTPCPLKNRDTVDRIALLLLLSVPSCASTNADPQRLLDVCTLGSAPDDGCALARYLYTERNPAPPDLREQLRWLLESGPAWLYPATSLKMARIDCEMGKQEEALKALLNIGAYDGEPLCGLAAQAEIAACLMVSPGHSGITDDVRNREAVDISQLLNCPEHTRGLLLGRRGYYRGRGGRWVDAAKDYREAYTLTHDPIYALGQSEALLHQNPPSPHEAGEIIQGLALTRESDPGNFLYASLLFWISMRDAKHPEKTEAAARRLVEFYHEIGDKERVLPAKQDNDLRKLACPVSPRVCVYDVLSQEKTTDSEGRLKRALGL